MQIEVHFLFPANVAILFPELIKDGEISGKCFTEGNQVQFYGSRLT